MVSHLHTFKEKFDFLGQALQSLALAQWKSNQAVPLVQGWAGWRQLLLRLQPCWGLFASGLTGCQRSQALALPRPVTISAGVVKAERSHFHSADCTQPQEPATRGLAQPALPQELCRLGLHNPSSAVGAMSTFSESACGSFLQASEAGAWWVHSWYFSWSLYQWRFATDLPN